MDIVGCGDSFVAAIAFGFIHNIPLVTTLAFANAVGAATAMGCGAGRNVATLKQVVELMEHPTSTRMMNFGMSYWVNIWTRGYFSLKNGFKWKQWQDDIAKGGF